MARVLDKLTGKFRNTDEPLHWPSIAEQEAATRVARAQEPWSDQVQKMVADQIRVKAYHDERLAEMRVDTKPEPKKVLPPTMDDWRNTTGNVFVYAHHRSTINALLSFDAMRLPADMNRRDEAICLTVGGGCAITEFNNIPQLSREELIEWNEPLIEYALSLGAVIRTSAPQRPAWGEYFIIRFGDYMIWSQEGERSIQYAKDTERTDDAGG